MTIPPFSKPQTICIPVCHISSKRVYEYSAPPITGNCSNIVTLYPLLDGVADYKLVESVSEGCLFPEEDLYPEETLYPDFGEWNKLRDEVNYWLTIK